MILIPEIFPSIQWFILAQKQGKNNLLQHFSAPNNKYTNKYIIAGPNQIQTLIVPVIASTKSADFCQVQIDYSQKWIREHKNALQTAYGKSPFFEYYDYRIFNVFDQQIPELAQLNETLLALIIKLIGLENVAFSPLLNVETTSIFNSDEIEITTPPFSQVFDDRYGFRSNVSIIDLLFNLGPLCKDYFQAEF
jgi:hypothetical protein